MTTQLGSGQEGGLQDPESYCKDLVRKRDYEWFLVAHFYPKELQGAFFALRAFYVSNRLHPVWDRAEVYGLVRLSCQQCRKRSLIQCLGK